MIAFRPDLFGPREEYDERMDGILRQLRGANPGGAPVVLPGERARARVTEQTRDGVRLPDTLVAGLDELAAAVGVDDRLG
jgi:LDH2 family malate/lactate/ureidoglycolate dehydrogenase